jgi:hypothetical protein
MPTHAREEAMDAHGPTTVWSMGTDKGQRERNENTREGV